jgi:hypothetical protein
VIRMSRHSARKAGSPADGSVSAGQRFSPADPCPICGGHQGTPSGSGSRCWGFRTSDGKRVVLHADRKRTTCGQLWGVVAFR